MSSLYVQKFCFPQKKMSVSSIETAAWLMTTLQGKSDIKTVKNALGQTFKVGDKVYFPDPNPAQAPKSSSKSRRTPTVLKIEGVVVAFVNQFVAVVRYDNNAWSKSLEFRHAIPVDFLERRTRI